MTTSFLFFEWEVEAEVDKIEWQCEWGDEGYVLGCYCYAMELHLGNG